MEFTIPPGTPPWATVLDKSDAAGGLMLLRLTALIPVGALAGGWLSARLPLPAAATGGMLLTAIGFLRLSGWDAGVEEPRISADLACLAHTVSPLDRRLGTPLGAGRPGSRR